MEVFVLHILKLNIIAAIVILLVKLLARPLKNKVPARWKYFIWMFVVAQPSDSDTFAGCIFNCGF